jgi:F0F1-type ATP synthase assembly protein I
MRSLLPKNKRGGFTDLFLFMIFAFILVVVIGILLYTFGRVETQLHTTMDDMSFGDGTTNTSQVIVDSVGATNISLSALYWLSVFIMFGMILGIFIGSYLVTTKPVFFIPYLFIWIIAIIVSVPISNSYETISATDELASTYTNFVGANFLLGNLPIIVAVVGIVGAIIMFSRMGRREEYAGFYG